MYPFILLLYATLSSTSPIDSATSPDPIPSINVNGAAASISSYMASPSFTPYSIPNEDVVEWIALGDSFTAGTGCNGVDEVIGSNALRGQRSVPMQMKADADSWEFINTHGGGVPPRFSFSAYTGDKTEDLITSQLVAGAYKDTNPNLDRHPFGAPQLAIMTIGGNDAYLGDLVNDCLYHAWNWNNCDDTITKLQNDINSGSLKDKISLALYSTAMFGRQQGGANPRESFQVYISEYIPYFDETTTPCNDYTWNWWLTDSKLTQDLRQRLNSLAKQVNVVIDDAATELERLGVIFVKTIADQYMSGGHQFCAPGHDGALEMTDTDTWFWSQYFPTGSTREGLDAQSINSTSFNDTILQPVLDFVYGQGNVTPQDYATSAYFNQQGPTPYATFDDLLNAMGESDQPVHVAASLMVKRSMHPKGSPFGVHRDAFMAAIANNRGAGVASQTSSAAPPAASETSSSAPAPSPTSAQDICGDWYKVLFDSFQIFGKNFDDRLGDKGKGLQDNLNGCGDLTNFHFEPLTDDPNGYTWKAYGNLPIGTKACVGQALQAVGGNPDGCTGAG